MVAADHDRRLQLARGHHLVEGETEAMAVAEAHPADARRQALELDALAGHVEPVVQVRVVRASARFTLASVLKMSSGSPESAAQRNGPMPRQNSGRM